MLSLMMDVESQGQAFGRLKVLDGCLKSLYIIWHLVVQAYIKHARELCLSTLVIQNISTQYVDVRKHHEAATHFKCRNLLLKVW